MSENPTTTFLQRVVRELLKEHSTLKNLTLILPGKRPAVFIRKILKEENYVGILPRFQTIDELVTELSGLQKIEGISLWLKAFNTYSKIDSGESLDAFLKWFPTIIKDWDDMLKFSEKATEVLDFMLSDERIKNWGQLLGEETPHKKNLTFWKKMSGFLPQLKADLLQENWATSGMIYEKTKSIIEEFSAQTDSYYVFCGFNAFSPVEEKLVRHLLQNAKARCFFQADEYYIKDKRQEAGKFLRNHMKWKEFNENRPFEWIENHFSEEKNIQVYEASGSIAETKILPYILGKLKKTHSDLERTAVVLMDENLLPSVLESLQYSVSALNITMGFPLKNLSFSTAIRKLFYLQKQLDKQDSSYYHSDLLPLLEELPHRKSDEKIINDFASQVEKRNLVYIPKSVFTEHLSQLSYFKLLVKTENTEDFLNELIVYCGQCKSEILKDIDYENISAFQKAFVTLKNQLSQYDFLPNIATLEVLINQLVSTGSIDFEGEPLSGIQVMGLLETRLLDFENVIMISANEGKIPLGKTQNTFLPFDVRAQFHMNTFLENDSIYAYHFYRLIQEAKNVYITFNGLSSGLNTGEKSRFITQIEMESPHKIKNYVMDNSTHPVSKELISIAKTPIIMEKLNEWKNKVSPSHLISYLYNPIDFYLQNILKVREPGEIEEELSSRNFGNLVHKSLEYLYKDYIGKNLNLNDLNKIQKKIPEALNYVIEVELNHSLKFYERGMNYIHKTVAQRNIEDIIKKDIQDIEEGNSLQIVALEEKLHGEIFLDEAQKDRIVFYGFADRIDRLNQDLRIIDFKSGKADKLNLKLANLDAEKFNNYNQKQALQLAIYAYCVLTSQDFPDKEILCGIWSFKSISSGLQNLTIDGEEKIGRENLEPLLGYIKTLIQEILNPEIPFVETELKDFNL